MPENFKKPKAKSQKPMAIPYGKQHITQADIDAVVEVLRSDYLTQGPTIKKFEDAFADYVEAKYAVAVANGTAALHLNVLALGLKPGEKVITTPITFVASANCVRYAGGEVVFADIDPETYLLDINHVRQLLEEDTQNEIKGIIPVDFAGRVVDMEAYRALADQHGCWLIEDACHAPGGYFVNSLGQKVKAGSGRYADLAIFSFHPVKHIATGEGGMITTNDEKLYKRLLQLRTHGITKDPKEFQNSIETAIGISNIEKPRANSEQLKANIEQRTANSEYPGWYQEMTQLGYNYRLSDIQAALGLSQLARATEGLKKRREIAARYYEAFKDHNAISGQSGMVDGHAYHLYVIEVADRVGLYNYLRENKIYGQIHYVPAHTMPYYVQTNNRISLPVAEEYYGRCISLPMYPTLSNDEQDFVIRTVCEYLNG